MIGREAFWFTADMGRTWTRLCNQTEAREEAWAKKGLILRVAFLDPRHGFAVGLQKSGLRNQRRRQILGALWVRPQSHRRIRIYSEYTHVAFTGDKRGMIVGGYSPPRKDGESEPDWVDPERALQRRQVPTLTIEMETRDGGLKWSSATAPLLGSLISLSLKATNGLGVFAYADSFMWPSEVFHFDLGHGQAPTACLSRRIAA